VWVHGERPGRAILYARGAACELLPGQRALARIRLEALRPPSNPGAFDARRRLARRGVQRLARLSGEALAPIGDPPGGPAAWIERARRALAERLDPPDLPTRAGALLRALAVADVSRLDEGLREAFARSGTTHLLSVSGTHIVWVFWLIRFCVGGALARSPALALVRAAPRVAVAAGAAAGAGYALLCGLEPPALRSAAMAAAGALALLGGRPAASWNALALAGLLVLALDPAALFEPSFQLSFAAVAGLLVWRPPPGALRGIAHASLAAGLASAPLAADLGAPLPAGWLVANALAVPYFGVLVVPPALVAGVLGGPLPVLPAAVRAVTELGIRGLEELATPDLLAGPCDRVALAAALAASAFALRALALQRRGLALALGALAAVAGVLAWPRANGEVAAPEVVFLDVGHGDAALVRAGRRAWLVDAGTRAAGWDAGHAVVLPALRALGVRRLAALALTHADLDHVGGARAVLEAVPVGELWVTRNELDAPGLRALRAAAARRAVPVRIVAAGDELGTDGLRIAALWPPAGFAAPTTNASSLVLRVGEPGACALLGGDAPAAVERALAPALSPCDVLKLGHHGSATSSAAALLDALAPVVAIASAGRRPGAPLPHPEVRARLAARAISLYETRRDGALQVELARPGPRVRPWLVPRWRDGDD
jgi:competence protein ComEC